MKKKIIISIISVFAALVLVLVAAFSVLAIRTAAVKTDYSYLLRENRISEVRIEGVPLVKQDISCGYAIIEMLSSYYGNPITEEELYEKNDHGVSTASTKGFVNEINDCIKATSYRSKEYLNNDELLLTIYRSLQNRNPVAVEWAAKLDGEWTLHWSVVTGMDANYLYVNNPYGYYEAVSYEDFIARTTFSAFEKMPLGYSFGFAFGLFSKNTIIVAEGV